MILRLPLQNCEKTPNTIQLLKNQRVTQQNFVPGLFFPLEPTSNLLLSSFWISIKRDRSTQIEQDEPVVESFAAYGSPQTFNQIRNFQSHFSAFPAFDLEDYNLSSFKD
jgi:hypothetical protein